MIAQVGFDEVAQVFFVLCLDISEERCKSPGYHDGSYGVEAFAAVGGTGVGEDGDAFVCVWIEAFASLEV